MGFCCTTNINDPEIEEARTVHEIIVILNNRKLGIPIEKKEIEEFLIDPTKEVKSIGIENIDNESLKKRIPFLTKMESAYQKMIQLLEENNTNLDVNDIKPYVKNVTNKYFITYDPNNDLEKELKKFVEYMENFRKNKKL